MIINKSTGKIILIVVIKHIQRCCLSPSKMATCSLSVY